MSGIFQRVEDTLNCEFRRLNIAVQTFLFIPTRQLLTEQVW
jgi:hypothetical protein